MKQKYYGYFGTAQGTHNREPYTDTNRAELIKSMKKIARGNCLMNSTAHWEVSNADKSILVTGQVRN